MADVALRIEAATRSLATLREEGMEAMAVASLAALTGTSNDVAPKRSMIALAADFDPAKFWNLPKGTRITRTDLAIHGICEACAAK